MMKTRIDTLKFVASMIVLVEMTVFTGCKKAKDATAEDSASKNTDRPLSVYVVNYPLRYFAERIGGPDARVAFPAPAKEDPAFWNPSPKQISACQKADLILLNGASYAKWIPRASLPASKMVDTSVSFTDKFIPLEDKVTHSHGLEGKHEHGDVAFTTWLDPQQAIAQARAVRDALIRLRPGAAEDFNQRFNLLAEDLKDLDDQLAAVVTEDASRPLVFSHPIYQYFIRSYGINGQEVHWEPEESPTPEQWAELKQLLTEQPAQWMIWEGTPNPSTVDELKKIGLDSLTFEPCGNVPETGDYLSVMRDNILNLKKAFAS